MKVPGVKVSGSKRCLEGTFASRSENTEVRKVQLLFTGHQLG